MNTKTMKFTGVEYYNNGGISGVDENTPQGISGVDKNTPSVALDITLN